MDNESGIGLLIAVFWIFFITGDLPLILLFGLKDCFCLFESFIVIGLRYFFYF